MNRQHWILARFSQLRRIAKIERLLSSRSRYAVVR